MSENELSFIIRGCIFKVHKKLGPGLLESVYQMALVEELRLEGLEVDEQVPIGVVYLDKEQEIGFKLDILVENKVVIEIKSVEILLDVHHRQLITYLKLSGMKLGLLVNFNVPKVSTAIFRKVNNL